VQGEGCAIFFKRSMFRMVRSHSLPLSGALDADPAFFEPYSTYKETADVFREVSSVGQFVLLETVVAGSGASIDSSGGGRRGGGGAGGGTTSGDGCGDGNGDGNGDDSSGRSRRLQQPRSLVVCNTHLYFHPAAPHVRLLQVATLLREAERMLADAPAGTGLLFAGDLNSTPETGAVEFLSTVSLFLFLFVAFLSAERGAVPQRSLWFGSHQVSRGSFVWFSRMRFSHVVLSYGMRFSHMVLSYAVLSNASLACGSLIWFSRMRFSHMVLSYAVLSYGSLVCGSLVWFSRIRFSHMVLLYTVLSYGSLVWLLVWQPCLRRHPDGGRAFVAKFR
jgi:hypothetical protein